MIRTGIRIQLAKIILRLGNLQVRFFPSCFPDLDGVQQQGFAMARVIQRLVQLGPSVEYFGYLQRFRTPRFVQS